jgi:hypothetical protein
VAARGLELERREVEAGGVLDGGPCDPRSWIARPVESNSVNLVVGGAASGVARVPETTASGATVSA